MRRSGAQLAGAGAVRWLLLPCAPHKTLRLPGSKDKQYAASRQCVWSPPHLADCH
jgi:hypothetical protein